MKGKAEITLEELADLPEGLRLLIDTRDELSMAYGTIPGAIQIPNLLEQAEKGMAIIHSSNQVIKTIEIQKNILT